MKKRRDLVKLGWLSLVGWLVDGWMDGWPITTHPPSLSLISPSPRLLLSLLWRFGRRCRWWRGCIGQSTNSRRCLLTSGLLLQLLLLLPGHGSCHLSCLKDRWFMITEILDQSPCSIHYISLSFSSAQSVSQYLLLLIHELLLRELLLLLLIHPSPPSHTKMFQK